MLHKSLQKISFDNRQVVKDQSEKVGLKLNIQKTKVMASGPITSWEIDGETVETVPDFIFGSRAPYQPSTSGMRSGNSWA